MLQIIKLKILKLFVENKICKNNKVNSYKVILKFYLKEYIKFNIKKLRES